MALLSGDAAFYAWAASTWALAASVAVAIVRGWARGRGLRLEDITTGFRAALMLVSALLSQISLRLYTVHVTVPEALRRRGGQEHVGVEAALERIVTDEAYDWPLGCWMLAIAVLVIFLARDARRRVGRAPPPPPRRAAAGPRRDGVHRVSVVEIVLFLVFAWACVYSFPVTVRNYMAATAKGEAGDPAAA
ncbi:hypothetical protein ACP70R_046265 [Stipagrostis hirtigluma subsp. patula]